MLIDSLFKTLRFVALRSPPQISFRILRVVYGARAVNDRTFLVRIRNGMRMFANPHDWVQANIFVLNAYEKKETTFVENILEDDDVFFDVGSNVGYYTLIAANKIKRGKVYAFEMEPGNYKAILENLALNALENVQVTNCAVSDTPGKITFAKATNDNKGIHSLFHLEGYSVGSGEADAITLDDFVRDNAITKVSKVKIDVEGAELLVLRGMKNILTQFSPEMLVEINAFTLKSAGVKLAEVYDFLAGFGYAPYRITSASTHEPIRHPEEGSLVYFKKTG